MVKERGEKEEDICIWIEGLENFLVMQDLEFLLVSFNCHFSMGIFAPDDAAGIFFIGIKRLSIDSGPKGFFHDRGFGANHVY